MNVKLALKFFWMAMDDSNIIMMGKVANQMQNLYISFTFSWYSY